jgi:hypothetical protein
MPVKSSEQLIRTIVTNPWPTGTVIVTGKLQVQVELEPGPITITVTVTVTVTVTAELP